MLLFCSGVKSREEFIGKKSLFWSIKYGAKYYFDIKFGNIDAGCKFTQSVIHAQITPKYITQKEQ